MKKLVTLLWVALLAMHVHAQETSETLTEEQQKAYLKKIDSINNSFTYEYGKVELQNGLAEIQVPKGYKFLNAKQSKYVLTDLWGNPPSDVLGMLLPETTHPISENFTYAVEITYSDDGYIDDDDAKSLDYDELLKQMKEDTQAGNSERKKLGYPAIDFIGWASAPFYDANTKKLHWAKELNFEGEDTHTLNYNIRVLGRNGYLNLNAIGTIDVLPQFKNDVDQILQSVAFTDGNTYADFNPDIDKVAAYGIGGLIAGKVLAKAGFFAMILKFWKIIAIGIVGLFTAFKNKLFGSKKEE